MFEDQESRCQVFEHGIVSGVIRVTLDKQFILAQRFESHVRVAVIFDKGVICDNRKNLFFSPSLSKDYDLQTGNSEDVQMCQKISNFENEEISLKCDPIVQFNRKVTEVNLSAADSGAHETETRTFSSSEQNLRRGEGRVDGSPGLHVEDIGLSDTLFPVSEDCGEIEEIHKETEKDGVRTRKSKRSCLTQRKRKGSINDVDYKTLLKNKKRFTKSETWKDMDRLTGNKSLSKARKGKLVLKIQKDVIRTQTTNQFEKLVQEPGGGEKVELATEKVAGKGNAIKEKVKKWAVEKDVFCEFCNKMFKSQQAFFDHRKSSRNEFKCKLCGKVVPFRAHLMVHMHKHGRSMLDELAVAEGEADKLIVHSSASESTEVGDMGTGEAHGKSGVKGVKCDVCCLVMSNIPVLKTHCMTHTGEMAYRCCVCQEETHSMARYKNHMMTHVKGGQVQCKICNKFFPSRGDLSKHQLTHELKCGLCGSVFPNKTSRAFHYKMAHKDDILKCHICGKLYSSTEELEAHLSYHRQRSKTQCPVCGVLVLRLEKHMISHGQHSEGVKVYTCDKCQKEFKQKLSYQRHLQTHTEDKPYACMECPKRFARSGGLRRHMLTHTQEKPYVCDICGKACSQMGNLKIHMQIHKTVGDSAVSCSLCGQNCPHRQSLQEHMNSVHLVEMSSVEASQYVMPPIITLPHGLHSSTHGFYPS